MEIYNFVRSAASATIPLALLDDLILVAVVAVDCLTFGTLFGLVDHEIANPADEVVNCFG